MRTSSAPSRDAFAPPAWVDDIRRVDASAGLLVLAEPVVVDARAVAAVCAAGATVPLACLRARGSGRPALWHARGPAAGTLLAALAAGTPADRDALAATATVLDADAGLCDAVPTAAALRAVEDRLLGGTGKASDTFLARHVDRHVSRWLTRRLMRTAVTPNHVTLGSTLVGLAGVALLLLGTFHAQVAGAALVLLATIVDGVDGELARLKFLESELGRRLDFWLDNVVNALALFATGAGHGLATGAPLYVYASAFNLVAAALTTVPVYFLFFRPGSPAGSSRLERVLGLFAGRDYAYLVLALALGGVVHWFTWLCLVGLSVFLGAALVLLAHRVAHSRP